MRGLGLAVLLAFLVVCGAVVWSGYRLAQVSTQPLSLGSPSNVQHILILGYGGGDHPGAYLSDSMVLAIDDGGRQAEVSIPRDLWVQLPPSSGHYAKINEALQDGYNRGGLSAGGDMSAKKVEQVTGLAVTGWVLQDFQGFRQMIDALGGVDVNVERAFSAQYPVNDNPNVDARWKSIHFDAGTQHMSGDRALEYARARYADSPSEASDFARSARQQRLITAIRQKVASPSGVVRFLPLVNAVSGAVHTNLSPMDLASFVLGFHASQAKHVTLDSVLVDGRSGVGQDILFPRNSNYSLIANYIQEQLRT